MVHPANRSITQNFDSSHLFKFGWAEDVIDAPIVDCCVAGSASQITKVAQDVTVRFTIVLQIICIKICLVGSFEFKVEITRYENRRRLRSSLCPIDQCFCVGPSASSIECISVSAQEHNPWRVLVRSE